MSTEKPILLLAFANDPPGDASYLRDLVTERKTLRSALRASDPNPPPWEVVDLPNATLAELFDTFQDPRYAGRIVLLHFAGHADGGELVFERNGVSPQAQAAGGIARFFARQAGLRFVFLNACASWPTGKQIFEAGVPAVVATSRAIRDDYATAFAARFYQGIAMAQSLEGAFNTAADEQCSHLGDEFALAFDASVRGADARFPGCATEIRRLKESQHWPWELLSPEGAAGNGIRNWSIVQAVKDPLLGVPPLPAGMAPPARDRTPYRLLAHFEARDAPIFFGRGNDLRDVWQKIGRPDIGMILLHGPSGAGKSSFLEAGLLPRLQRRVDGGTHEVVILRRSRTQGLERQLLAALRGKAGTDAGTVADLWRRIEAGGTPLLVVLDQAEESFTRPRLRGDPDAEWNDLLTSLMPLFGPSVWLPRGKLILSFRKE